MQMSASLLRWFWILKLFDKRSGGVRYGNLIAFPNLLRKTRTSEQFDSFFLFLFYRIATRVLNPWVRVQPDRQKFFAMRIERFFFLSLFSFLLWRRTWRHADVDIKYFLFTRIWICSYTFFSFSFTILEYFPHSSLFPRNRRTNLSHNLNRTIRYFKLGCFGLLRF